MTCHGHLYTRATTSILGDAQRTFSFFTSDYWQCAASPSEASYVGKGHITGYLGMHCSERKTLLNILNLYIVPAHLKTLGDLRLILVSTVGGINSWVPQGVLNFDTVVPGKKWGGAQSLLFSVCL